MNTSTSTIATQDYECVYPLESRRFRYWVTYEIRRGDFENFQIALLVSLYVAANATEAQPEYHGDPAPDEWRWDALTRLNNVLQDGTGELANQYLREFISLLPAEDRYDRVRAALYQRTNASNKTVNNWLSWIRCTWLPAQEKRRVTPAPVPVPPKLSASEELSQLRKRQAELLQQIAADDAATTKNSDVNYVDSDNWWKNAT